MSYGLSRELIVCYGDSITQYGFDQGGWVSLLSQRYSRRADVLNRGFSGYNSRWCGGRKMLENVFFDGLLLGKKHAENDKRSIKGGLIPGLVIVFLGANDSCAADSLQKTAHVPPSLFAKKMEGIVDFLVAECAVPASRVVLVSPPPVDGEKWLEVMKLRFPEESITKPDRNNEQVQVYVDILQKIAVTKQCNFLDVFSEMLKKGEEWKNYFFDGLHFSEAGNTFFFEKLIELIEDRIPSFSVSPDPVTQNPGNGASSSTILPHFPWWDQAQGLSDAEE